MERMVNNWNRPRYCINLWILFNDTPDRKDVIKMTNISLRVMNEMTLVPEKIDALRRYVACFQADVHSAFMENTFGVSDDINNVALAGLQADLEVVFRDIEKVQQDYQKVVERFGARVRAAKSSDFVW